MVKPNSFDGDLTDYPHQLLIRCWDTKGLMGHFYWEIRSHLLGLYHSSSSLWGSWVFSQACLKCMGQFNHMIKHHMDSYRDLMILMDISWIFHGYLWIHVDPCGFLWILWIPNGLIGGCTIWGLPAPCRPPWKTQSAQSDLASIFSKKPWEISSWLSIDYP